MPRDQFLEGIPFAGEELEITLRSSSNLYEEVFEGLPGKGPLVQTCCGNQHLLVVNDPSIAGDILAKAKATIPAPMNAWVDTIHHPVGEGAPPLHWLSKLTYAMSCSVERFKKRVKERPHLWKETFSNPLCALFKDGAPGIFGNIGLLCIFRIIFDLDVHSMHPDFQTYNDLTQSIRAFIANNQNKWSMSFEQRDENWNCPKVLSNFCEEILKIFDRRHQSCMQSPTDDSFASVFFECADEQAWTKTDMVRELVLVLVSGYDVISKALIQVFLCVDMKNASRNPDDLLRVLEKIMLPSTVGTRPVLFESDQDISLVFVQRGKTVSVTVPKGTLIMLNPATCPSAPSAPPPFPTEEISGSRVVHDLLEWAFRALMEYFASPHIGDVNETCEEFRITTPTLPAYNSVMNRLLLQGTVRSKGNP